MTNYASQYNFMDLLKDNAVTPQADLNSTSFTISFRKLFDQFSAQVELSYEAHDFMDLMHDKGFVPVHCNDNYLTANVA